MDNQVLDFIRQSDYLQVNDLLQKLMNRYKELYPNHEVYLFTLPEADDQERELRLEQTMEMIRNHR